MAETAVGGDEPEQPRDRDPLAYWRRPWVPDEAQRKRAYSQIMDAGMLIADAVRLSLQTERPAPPDYRAWYEFRDRVLGDTETAPVFMAMGPDHMLMRAVIRMCDPLLQTVRRYQLDTEPTTSFALWVPTVGWSASFWEAPDLPGSPVQVSRQLAVYGIPIKRATIGWPIMGWEPRAFE